MDNIFPFYFEMFDKIMRDKYDNKLTPDFKKILLETKTKLKDTFIYSDKYNEYCVIIDRNFDNYIKEKK